MKFDLKKLYILMVSLIGLWVGYLYADISYDYNTYYEYVSRFDVMRLRFSSEPISVYIVNLMLFISGDVEFATRMLYGVSLSLLILSISILYLTCRFILGKKSMSSMLFFLIPMIPLLMLVMIVPRQCLSLAFSIVALSCFLFAKAHRTELNGNRLYITIGTACVLAAFFSHNLSGMITILFLTLVFFNLSILLFITPIIVIVLFVFWGLFSGSLLDYGFDSAINKFGNMRDTGSVRVILFSTLSIVYILIGQFTQGNAVSKLFSDFIRFKFVIMLAIILIMYNTIATDIARSLYLPIVVAWLLIFFSFKLGSKIENRLS